METKKENLKEYIERLSRPIFEKVAQEMSLNHTMVVQPKKSMKKSVTPSLYNPHNYRLYFQFTKKNYNPKEGMVGVWFGRFKNYGKEFTALGEGIRVTIKKTQAEVINKQSEQEWYFIDRTMAKEEIIIILKRIERKCITSLKKFIKAYGGKTDFVILKREGRPDLNLFTKSDNKIKNEPFIDKLPLNMTFETDIVSKRYKLPEVEFKEPVYAAHYLENSALKEFAPELAQEIQANREITSQALIILGSMSKNLAYVAENYKSHVGMVEEGTKLLKRLNKKLSQKKLKEYL